MNTQLQIELFDLNPYSFLSWLQRSIRYGWIDRNNKEYSEPNEEYELEYRLQRGLRLLDTKVGHCWDFVELQRQYFKYKDIPHKSYLLTDIPDGGNKSHTISVYEQKGNSFYFEMAWHQYYGIFKSDNIKDFLKWFLPFYERHAGLDYAPMVFEYSEPDTDMNIQEFLDHCWQENNRIIT